MIQCTDTLAGMYFVSADRQQISIQLHRTDRQLQKALHGITMCDYLRELPLYETAEAGRKDYLLVHAGLENFSPDRKLSDYSADELIWNSPKPGDRYFDGVTTVFGHTPTFSFGEKYRGGIYRTATWMDIDAGAAWGCEPVLLRLDDMKAFRL